jgi:hypothetical protein
MGTGENNNNYFYYKVCFRISDAPEYHDEIEKETGLTPTHIHKKGDPKKPESRIIWDNNIWMMESPIEKEKIFNEHFAWLFQRLKPNIKYFQGLQKKKVKMDIYCSYRTNCETGGFDLDPYLLGFFKDFPIPVGFSILIV